MCKVKSLFRFFYTEFVDHKDQSDKNENTEGGDDKVQGQMKFTSYSVTLRSFDIVDIQQEARHNSFLDHFTSSHNRT